jgi:uncharacterized protein YceH (UPF0502 family)
MVQLNAVEARVLGCLVEKEITTPENYPLSLNALVNACNQKSSREPVMELREADVRSALFELDNLGLVRTLADARVSKFEHRVRDVLGQAPGNGLRRDEVAVICLLLLRGPQTPAELRARAERLYPFDDNAAAVATLERLARREEPMVQLMARQPGAREARWMHLLCGPVETALAAASTVAGVESQLPEGRAIDLAARVDALEETVQTLEERLQRLEGIFGGN